MDKILQITYQGRTFSMEEKAYQQFQDYEQRLQEYFSQDEGGDETFADLQYRMGEILEQQAASKPALDSRDIEFLMASIGQPADFDQEGSAASTAQSAANTGAGEKKKLYRDRKNRIIAGVCSGIANYFAIDPIAVRLIFVVFTLFNVVTLFALNLGILAYIVLWVVLTPKILEPNWSRKLFRNPKDRVLGGVCSGLAQFFHTETWIIRLIFLGPIILGMAGNRAFGNMNLHLVGDSFYALPFIAYIVLWVITPLAKVSTDYMLLKGEPINLATIQHSASMQSVTGGGRSGFSIFLRMVAYLMLGFLLLIIIPSAIGLLGVAIYSYSLAEIVLFTPYAKVLALLTMILFLALPLLGILIWIIRKLAGYRSPNRALRITFIALHAAGWVSVMLLVTAMVREYNTFSSVKHETILTPVADTLYLASSDTSGIYSDAVFVELNQVDRIIHRTADANQVRAVRLEYEQSLDSVIRVVVEKSAFGSSRERSLQFAEGAVFNLRQEGNTLYVDPFVSVSNREPYHFQNVKVTVYYPKGVTVITRKELRKQLQFHFNSNRNGLNFSSDADDEEVAVDEIHHALDPDSVITAEGSAGQHTTSSDDLEEIREARQQLEETEREQEQALRDKQREVEEAQRELNQLEREAEREREQARRELERAEKKIR